MRPQRIRKINRNYGSLTKEDKFIIEQRFIDGLESDVFEEFFSSNESISEFDEDDDQDRGVWAGDTNKKRKKKKLKKDKKATLSKSKVNLGQMIAEEKRREKDPRVLNFQDITRPSDLKRQCPKICKLCLSKAAYTCPRCLDNLCSVDCLTVHKEIICGQYNYVF